MRVRERARARRRVCVWGKRESMSECVSVRVDEGLRVRGCEDVRVRMCFSLI